MDKSKIATFLTIIIGKATNVYPHERSAYAEILDDLHKLIRFVNEAQAEEMRTINNQIKKCESIIVDVQRAERKNFDLDVIISITQGELRNFPHVDVALNTYADVLDYYRKVLQKLIAMKYECAIFCKTLVEKIQDLVHWTEKAYQKKMNLQLFCTWMLRDLHHIQKELNFVEVIRDV